MVAIVILIGLFLFGPARLLAQDRYDAWRPVTEADWRVVENEALGIRHAVIIFFGTIIDDRDLKDDESVISHYQRVRVLDDTGIEAYNTVEIPYSRGSRIVRLRARTLKGDGREIEVDDSQIFEKTVLSFGSARIRAKSFAFSNVEPGDILEYFVVERGRRDAPPLVELRRSSYSLEADLVWYFRPMPHLSQEERFILRDYFYSPRWALTNAAGFTGKLEQLPDEKRPDRIHVVYHNLPPLPDDPYLPARQGYATAFYGSYHYPNEEKPYWERVSRADGKDAREFLRKKSRLDAWMGEILGQERDLDQDLDRCLALVHRDIENTDLLPDDKLAGKREDCENVDDVLESRRGTHRDINLLYTAMLHRLGYEATLFYTRGREYGAFLAEWQTTSQFTLVGVAAKRGDKFEWCFPSSPYSEARKLPWQAFGCRGLLTNLAKKDDDPGPFPLFADTPMGSAEWNKTVLEASLRLDDTHLAGGTLKVTWDCASDPALPLRLDRKAESETIDELNDRALWSGVKWSRQGETTARDGPSITYACEFTAENLVEEAGSRLLVTLGLLRPDGYSLPDRPREAEIWFGYPARYECTAELELPEGYIVEKLPAAASFESVLGRYDSELTVDESGRKAIRRRSFVMSHSAFRPEGVAPLRAFFDQVYAADAEPLVLRIADANR